LAEAALGLDRAAMVLESAGTIFDTAALTGLKDAAVHGPLSGVQDLSAVFTVLDHIRSFCCLVAAGARPSGRGRGHILRRLLRKAVRVVEDHAPGSEKTLSSVAALLPEHPESCCTIDVASQWPRVSETLERELRLLDRPRSAERRG
jgi:alanyl-tRNA synthetase